MWIRAPLTFATLAGVVVGGERFKKAVLATKWCNMRLFEIPPLNLTEHDVKKHEFVWPNN